MPLSGDGMAEFLALADQLKMPESERQNILGISEADWPAIVGDPADSTENGTDEFRRRLAYILPLMRRAVANSTPSPAPEG